jgi:type IV pilus assembly protein PilV
LRNADRRREEGFTLLELVIAMGILAVGLLAIATAQIWAINRASQSRHLSQALHLAQQQMEFFHATPVANLPIPCTPTPTCDDPFNPIQVDATDSTTFQRNWLIEPDTPTVGITRITVSVDWVDKNGFVRTTQIQSMKAL